MNLVFGNTLNYFYGYTSPNFGTYQATDAFSAQNVNFASQVSMVSTSSALSAYASLTYNGSSYSYTTLASAYGYATPATQAVVQNTASWTDVYTAQTTSSPASNNANTTSYSAVGTYSPITTYQTTNYQFVNGSNWGIGTSSSNTASSVSGWGDVLTSSTVDTSSGGGGWAAVDMSVTPKVASVVSNNPVVAPPSPLPAVNTNGDIGIQLAVPEPSTVLTVTSGLSLLLFGLYRRRRA